MTEAMADPVEPASAAALERSLGFVRRQLMDPVGRAILEYEAGLHMCHSGGVVQGGFISAWIDAAMAHAVIAMRGDEMTPMSLELKISFFAPARPGKVTAEGWVEKGGRGIVFTEGRLLNPNGEVLAKASSTIRLISRTKVEAASRVAL